MKRYAIFSMEHEINLFKDQRTFKTKTYAKRVLETNTRFIEGEFYIKEVEVLTLEAQLERAIEILKMALPLCDEGRSNADCDTASAIETFLREKR